MWEAISAILCSEGGIVIVVLLILLILILLVSAYFGLISFKGAKLRIGLASRSNEREIMILQLNFAKGYIASRMAFLDQAKLRYNGYIARYILEICLDEVTNWIMFNHLSTDPEYIKIKLQKIRQCIYSIDDVQPEYKTKKFQDTVDTWVKDIIEALVEIRSIYTKKDE